MGYYGIMKVAQTIASVVAALALAVSFVGAGFLVCTTPPVTTVFANLFSDDATSPFTRSQLVQVAEATRDYSFGAHEKVQLYRTIYDIDTQYRDQVVGASGTLPPYFPQLDVISNPMATTTLQFAAVFSGASEMYCFSADTISHLDDCYAIASAARPMLIVAAVVALAALVFTGIVGRKRAVARALLAAGIVVLVAFVGLGVWAFLDFNGLFTMFHQLFFSQGNWTFPYDSLLICALPTPFWMGMGGVWLAVTALASVLSIVVGAKLRR